MVLGFELIATQPRRATLRKGRDTEKSPVKSASDLKSQEKNPEPLAN
jgi:hypothetical protein